MKSKLLICLLILPHLVFSQKKSKYETWIVTEMPSDSGEIVELKHSSILFRTSHKVENYKVSEIEKITYTRKNSGRKGAFIGGTLGVGSGLLFGYFIDGIASIGAAFSGNKHQPIIIPLTLLSATGGALIGAAIGSDRSSIFIKKSQKKYDKNKKRLKKLIGTEN